MHEPPTPPTAPAAPVTPAARPDVAPTAAGRAGSRRLFSRVILPLVLFVGMVAGIAWVTQYVPWRGTRASTAVKTEPPPCVVFDNEDPGSRLVRSVWDANKSPLLRGSLLLKAVRKELTNLELSQFMRLARQQEEAGDTREALADRMKDLAEKELAMYVKEFETMQGGSYDFPFNNVTDENADLGVKFQSCACSSVQVCLLTADQFDAYQKAKAGKGDAKMPELDWKPLPVSETQGMDVPPRARGLTRVTWNPRDQKQERVNLTVEMWSHPQGRPLPRGKWATLLTTIRFLAPVEADVPGLVLRPVEANSSSSASFWCWSATRPQDQKLRVRTEKGDACFTFDVHPVSETERLGLQDFMWGEQHALVKAAWRVEVTAHEQRAGQQMDMGAFARRLSLFLDDDKEAHPGPLVKGMVSSDVQVGSGVGTQEGKINLGLYDAKLGYHKNPFKIRTEPGVVLRLVEQETFPTFLKVTLSRNDRESTKRRAVWHLQIDVPKHGEANNDFTGPLPDNSAIILTREIAGSPPRRIRILVEGTAGVSAANPN